MIPLQLLRLYLHPSAIGGIVTMMGWFIATTIADRCTTSFLLNAKGFRRRLDYWCKYQTAYMLQQQWGGVAQTRPILK
jgi:hypothetical protein